MNQSLPEDREPAADASAEPTAAPRMSGGEARHRRSEPEVNDMSVKLGTGRDWNQWCDLIDAWPGHGNGHAAIAKHVQDSYEIGAWWAQAVTVGYERITGLRQPYQQADGSFSISRSRKLAVNSAALRETLLDDSVRDELFPGQVTRLRSKTSAKAIRIEIGPGMATLGLQPIDGETTRVAIEHKHLPEADDAPEWQEFWSTWLDVLPAQLSRIS